MDHLQRRDLQPLRPAPGITAGRTSLRHPLRYRNHSALVRRIRAGLRGTLSRHVRVRHLGQGRPDAVLRAGPAGDQALLLLLGRARICLRLGNQGAAGAPVDISGAPRRTPAGVAGLWLCQRRTHAFPGDPEADAGAPPAAGTGRVAAPAQDRALLGRALTKTGSGGPDRSGMDRRIAAAPGRNGRDASDERRSARDVPQRGRRFQRYRGADPAADERPSQDLRGGVSRGQVQRTRLRRQRRENPWNGTPRSYGGNGGLLQFPAPLDLA